MVPFWMMESAVGHSSALPRASVAVLPEASNVAPPRSISNGTSHGGGVSRYMPGESWILSPAFAVAMAAESVWMLRPIPHSMVRPLLPGATPDAVGSEEAAGTGVPLLAVVVQAGGTAAL